LSDNQSSNKTTTTTTTFHSNTNNNNNTAANNSNTLMSKKHTTAAQKRKAAKGGKNAHNARQSDEFDPQQQHLQQHPQQQPTLQQLSQHSDATETMEWHVVDGDMAPPDVVDNDTFTALWRSLLLALYVFFGFCDCCIEFSIIFLVANYCCDYRYIGAFVALATQLATKRIWVSLHTMNVKQSNRQTPVY
jgi:hypothetical protein